MATVAELNVTIGADTMLLERGLSGVNTRLKNFGADLTRVGTQMTIGITAPIALMGAAVIKVGTDYERAMNIFQAVTRASGDEMSRAAKLAQQLGADMQLPATSAGDAAKAMTELAKGGLTASEAMDAARGTLQLAAAAGIDEARAAEIAANALNAFGLAASEAGRVSDLLAAAANASSAEINDIALSMQQSSAVAAQLKIPIEDLVTVIGEMANAGIKGSDAGTSLRVMLSRLNPETDKAKDAMKALGVNVFDAGGQMKPLRDIIEDMSGALGKATDQQKLHALQVIFGQDAMRAANVVFGQGVEKFDDMAKAVGRSGAAQELSAARAKGLSGAMDGLTSQLETLALAIYQSVAPGLESMVRMIADLVGSISQADKAVLQAGVTLAAVFAAAGPIAIGIGLIVSLLGGPLTLAVLGLTAAVGVLAAEWVLDMNKMGQSGAITADDVRTKFTNLAVAIGHALDTVSFAVNLLMATLKQLGQILFFATAPMLTIMFAMEDGVKGAVRRMEGYWNDMNASFQRSTDAMAAAIEGRWSGMLGNLVRGMAVAQQSIVRGWGETQRLFEARSKIKWDVAIGSADSSKVEKQFKDTMSRLGNIAGAGGAAAGKKFHDEFGEQVKAAMKAIVDAINKGLGIDKIGQVIHDKLAPIIEDFRGKVKLAGETIDATAASITGFVLRAEKIVPVLLAGDRAFGEWAKKALELKTANEAAATAIQNSWKAISDQFQELSNSLPRAWNTIIDGILKGSGRVGEDLLTLGVKIKGFAGDILNVFDTLPGKWGSAFQRTVNEIERWVNFIDSAIRLIQRILGEAQTGFGGLIEGIVGIFKRTHETISSSVAQTQDEIQKTAKATSQGADQVGTAMKRMGSESQQGASQLQSALALAGASIGAFLTGQSIGGVKGGIVGGLSGALAGFQIGGIFGAIIGGASGILGAIFGKGKSPLQKAQEAAQLQQAKDAIKLSQQQVLQAAEQTKQSMLETATKIRDLLESITFYTSVPKDAFKAFFRDLTKLMERFADMAKTWLGDASGKIKILAEDMKLVMEGIAQAPTALVGIGKYLGIADSSIVKFFVDLTKVFEAFGAMSEQFTRKAQRHMRQFSERMAPVSELLSGTVGAIAAMFDIKAVPAVSFDIWEASLRELVTRLQGISEYFDKYAVKAIGFFAEKVSPAVTLWKDSVDAIKSMVEIPMPKQEDFKNLFDGIKMALAGFSELATTLSTEALTKAESIAQTSLSIFTAIKAAVESLGALRDYKGIAQDTIDQLLIDFQRGIVMLNFLLLAATEWEEKAKAFEAKITSGAEHLAKAISTYVGSVTAAGMALSGLLQGPVSLTSTGSVGIASMGAGRSVSTSSVDQSIHVGQIVVPGDSPEGRALKEVLDRILGGARQAAYAT